MITEVFFNHKDKQLNLGPIFFRRESLRMSISVNMYVWKGELQISLSCLINPLPYMKSLSFFNSLKGMVLFLFFYLSYTIL